MKNKEINLHRVIYVLSRLALLPRLYQDTHSHGTVAALFSSPPAATPPIIPKSPSNLPTAHDACMSGARSSVQGEQSQVCVTNPHATDQPRHWRRTCANGSTAEWHACVHRGNSLPLRSSLGATCAPHAAYVCVHIFAGGEYHKHTGESHQKCPLGPHLGFGGLTL